MSRFCSFTLVLVLMSSAATLALAQAADRMKNADIVALVKAGLPEAAIGLAIEGGGTDFDLSSEAVTLLKSQGVSDGVIGRMRAAKDGHQTAVEPTTFQPVEMSAQASNTSRAEPRNGAATISQPSYAAWPVMTLRLSVQDGSAEPVLGLTKENILVEVDGLRNEDFAVASVADNDDTLAVALLLDRSGSMKGASLQEAKRAAIDFVTRSRQADKVAIGTFDSSVQFLTPLVTDRALLEEKIRSIEVGGDTALRDALIEGSRTLAIDKSPQKAIVVLTDGKDTASVETGARSLATLQQAAVPVYAVALGERVDTRFLQSVVDATGGMLFLAPGPGELLGIYRKITRQLHNHYVLKIRVNDPVRLSHTLRIVVRTPGFEAVAAKNFSVIHAGSASESRRVAGSFWLGLGGVFAGVAVGLGALSTVLRRMRRRPYLALTAVLLTGVLFGLLGALIGISQALGAF